MSMIGEARRISATLYERLRHDAALMPRVTGGGIPELPPHMLAQLPPELRAQFEALTAANATGPAVDEADLGPRVTIEKAWHAVHFLVAGSAWGTRADDPMSQLILGGDERGDDMGYGPARLHGPAAVATIAAALPDADALRSRFDPAAMSREEIYPGGWDQDRDELWSWIADSYEQVRALYRDAAAAHQAIVLWIS